MGFGGCSPILFDVSVRKHKWVLKVYTGCIDKRNEDARVMMVSLLTNWVCFLFLL